VGVIVEESMEEVFGGVIPNENGYDFFAMRGNTYENQN
jgi:hypothetical protein